MRRDSCSTCSSGGRQRRAAAGHAAALLQHQGKSGGYRTLVAANKGNRRVLFVFGFPKNERSNIDKDETAALKKLAAHLLSLTTQALDKAQRAGELMEVEEVDCDAKDQVPSPRGRA